ncbi:uncharacterized protein LOC119504273 isoform X2 [Xyrichtys novacula]|uniref:Uncharacterized protein LOC119504273 isoform X2 n=1 Tax=Xyrichtys novacula TaxID=13765 RepID=A0AAV1GKP9_XYRNO|nr:uncharacterized protein LOC119504273 isoform X2 [Xyrichtys novacula]
MMNTEAQWSAALASNNIRAIIRWLRRIMAEGEDDMEEILQTVSCWVQRTSEFAKKELLTLCFSRCHGLWMFLDRSSFTRILMLLQRLRNLLTLTQWAKQQLSSAHLWHGVGVPCISCRDTFSSSDVKHGCWNREYRALKQHIWLGRLVQWWGIMGLLPKYPEAHEVKRIAQMWKEMDQSHRKASLETPKCKEGEKERFGSLIQGIVTQLDRQHGCIWISGDSTEQCYPPPDLQALLKLALVPHTGKMSVQALIMYFVLDISNFLQCKDDLLKSFCKAFTIPFSLSQQIRAFWMLDHGHVKASMELLLSPKAAVPGFLWQHRCIIHSLLTKKQPQLALQYLHWTRPPIQSVDDAKLCANVLLQNSCVSDAWALLKKGYTENDNILVYFLQTCDGLGLCAEALQYIPAGYSDYHKDCATETEAAEPPKTGRPPCPLSAELYQAQRVNTVTPEDLIQLVRKAAVEVKKPYPRINEVLWPEYTERKSNSKETILSNQAPHHLTCSPSPSDVVEEPEQTAHTEEQHIYDLPESSHHLTPVDVGSESVSSITPPSSLPLLSWDPLYMYESTLTLQRISSLLTDGEKHSEDEEDEERDNSTPTSVEALPECPEVIVTLDGATKPVYLSCLDKKALNDMVFSAKGDEDVTTGALPHKDFLSTDSVSEPLTDKASPLYKRNDCSQSTPSLSEPCEGVHISPLPDHEKVSSPEDIALGPADVTDRLDCADSTNPQDQSDFMSSFDCLPKEQVHKTSYNPQQEEAVGYSNQGCATIETTQDLLTDLQQSLLPETPEVRGSKVSAGMNLQDISAQISCTSLNFGPTTYESAHIAQLKMDKSCVQGTSTMHQRENMDQVSTSFSPAAEAETATKPERRQKRRQAGRQRGGRRLEQLEEGFAGGYKKIEEGKTSEEGMKIQHQ